MQIALIVAASENNVIGKDNQLPWRLPDDLKYFKEKTEGHPLVMGRKTFESLPGLLPNRKHIIVTRDREYNAQGAEEASSLEEAFMFAKQGNDTEQIFVIGGGEIYKQALEHANVLYVTRVHATVDGDVYFPEIDEATWEEVERTEHDADDKHAHAFTFLTYKRKTRVEFPVQ